MTLLNMVADLGDGQANEDLNEHMQKVHEAVQLCQKPGTITLTVTINPTRGQHNTASIKYKVDSKPPKLEAPDTIMYDLGDGKYSRRHPDQPSLFVAGVDFHKGVNPETGEIGE